MRLRTLLPAPLKRAIRRALGRSDLPAVHPNPHGWAPEAPTTLRPHMRRFGLSSYAQQGEDLTLDRILGSKLGLDLRNYRGVYVDAGAYHPISHSTSFLLYLRGWRGLCIDLSEESCALVRRLRPRDVVVNAAVAARSGTAYVPEGVSLLNVAHDAPAEGASRTVPAMTMSEILSASGFDLEIDYLNIDVEGAELATLEGLDLTLHAPKVVSVEIHARDIASALGSDVARFLLEHGYDCVACNVITYFFLRSDLNPAPRSAAVTGTPA